MCFSSKANNELSPIEHNEELPLQRRLISVNVNPKLDESLMKTSDTFPFQIKETNSGFSKEDLMNNANTMKSSKVTQYNGDCDQSPMKTIRNEDNDEKNSSFKKIKVYYYNSMISGKNIFDNDIGIGINQDLVHSQQPTIFQSAFFQPKTAMIPKKDLICYTDSNNEVHLRNNQSEEEYSMRSCTCSKTKCLKKYCECYANNLYCVNCNCKDCENNPSFKTNQLKEMNEVITCTCTKSNCNKKYCECFKGGKSCNDQCRCINCSNKLHVYKGLSMERISVLIQNSKIYITVTQIYPDIVIDEKDLISNQPTSSSDTFKMGYGLNNQKSPFNLHHNKSNDMSKGSSSRFTSMNMLNNKRARMKEEEV